MTEIEIRARSHAHALGFTMSSDDAVGALLGVVAAAVRPGGRICRQFAVMSVDAGRSPSPRVSSGE